VGGEGESESEGGSCVDRWLALPCLTLSSMRDAGMAEILGASLRIMACGRRGRGRGKGG
jgi:hypothetical protein